MGGQLMLRLIIIIRGDLMNIVALYRYENESGSVSITPEKRNEEDIEYQYRLIADEGKLITDGENTFLCIDTNNVSQYFEIDKPVDESSIDLGLSQKAAAFDIITGK